MILYEEKQEFRVLSEKFEDMSAVLDPKRSRSRLAELETEMGRQGFWDDPQLAADILRNAKVLETQLQEYHEVQELIEDGNTALELANEDDSMEAHFQKDLRMLRHKVRDFELKMVLNEQFDMNNAFLSIHPGAGGTESQDWAQMLLRMYLRWAERRGFETEIIEVQPGDEAGIKDATLLIKGNYVYGYLKYEKGVHRLVRISPFDSSKRRHTSFVSVNLMPELDDCVEVEINPDDLRVDVYRASGAGGQYVNRTESAVRITHLPTGFVVACQNQRSQHQNKETAMKILAAKLYEREMEIKRKEADAIQGELTGISWGNQIRSYVFHPYKMIKDLRTEHETGNVDSVMDGDLDAFIESELIYYTKGKK